MSMKPDQLTKDMIQSFTDFIQLRFNGETPHTLYSRFKKMIKAAVEAHVMRKNPNIRRAFIFCLYAGLRWCEVKDLTCGNVDYANRVLCFEQNKTK